MDDFTLVVLVSTLLILYFWAKRTSNKAWVTTGLEPAQCRRCHLTLPSSSPLDQVSMSDYGYEPKRTVAPTDPTLSFRPAPGRWSWQGHSAGH